MSKTFLVKLLNLKTYLIFLWKQSVELKFKKIHKIWIGLINDLLIYYKIYFLIISNQYKIKNDYLMVFKLTTYGVIYSLNLKCFSINSFRLSKKRTI